jgi:hypothetical protein
VAVAQQWDEDGADVLPLLSLRFGIGPRDVNVPTGHGGITWPQLQSYISRLDEWPNVVLGAVCIAEGR